MKHFTLAIALLMMAVSAAVADTYVAILQTRSTVLTAEEKEYVTDKIRTVARSVLPKDRYSIMTQENIMMMLPPGKTLEECEGSCLVETGKKIAAHYICQGNVSKVGSSLSVTVQLYSTENNDMVESFTERAKDVDQLVNVIEGKIGAIFMPLARKAGPSFSEGVVFRSTSDDFDLDVENSYVVNVSSNPAGAFVAVDGRPIPSCKGTPCSVELTEGSHQFVLGLEQYFDKDTVVNISARNKKVHLEMTPNFGTLSFSLQYGYGEQPTLTIDDRQREYKAHRLSHGKHKVKLTHRCYETMEFDVGIVRGSTQTISQMPSEGKGGLILTAESEGLPKELPVYVNGIQVGSTPFKGKVPVCAKVKVGDEELEQLKLKYHETVKYAHKVGGGAVETVKIGNQVWMKKNMDVEKSDSWCYDNKPENCKKYGRLYKWAAAMKLPGNCNNNWCVYHISYPHQGICPAGFHIPTQEELETLLENTGKKIRANSWVAGNDLFDFSLLPSGFRRNYGGFYYLGEYAMLWSSSEHSGDDAWYLGVNGSDARTNYYYVKDYGFSVRCLQNSRAQ